MDLLRYAQERLRRADALIDEITKEKEIACGKGCNFCCFGVPLWVKPPEALQIAHTLNKLPIRERKEIASRLSAYRREYREQSRSAGYEPASPIREEELNVEKLGIVCGLGMNDVPCPFLDQESGSCRVYEARPLMCRLTLYRDRGICEEDWKNPISFLWKKEISPFIEGIKTEFHKKWSAELRKMEENFPQLDIAYLEGYVLLLPEHLRFDPIRKSFRLKL